MAFCLPSFLFSCGEDKIRLGPVTIGLRNLSNGVKGDAFSTDPATMPVIASTGAMLLCGLKEHQWEVGLSLPNLILNQLGNSEWLESSFRHQ